MHSKAAKIALISTLVFASCKGSPSKPNVTAGRPGGVIGDPNTGDPDPTNPNSQNAEGIPGLKALETVTAFPRLSHLQWSNAVRDLLLLTSPSTLAKGFPPDPEGSDFGNNSELLKVTAGLWTSYQNAAETLGDQIGKDQVAYKKLMPAGKTDAKSIVEAFLRRAYRRKATAAEVTEMVGIYNNGAALTGIKDVTGAGMSAMVATVLQSPNFIYRVELGDKQNGSMALLNAYELASRLSFAAWNSIPDDELLNLAESGELLKPATLKVQVARLMKDARATEVLSFVHNKAFKIDTFVLNDANLKTFPELTGIDNNTLYNEADLFLKDVVITSNKGLHEILTAPYAFVNAKTAPIYGVATSDTEMKKVDLNPAQRAGILSQIGFLASRSKQTEGRTAIIPRGHYVTESLLCAKMLGVPDPGKESEKTFKTERERIADRTSPAGCAGCHAKTLNPPGFGLENFGPSGKYRTAESNGSPINAVDAYDFGDESVKFDGPVELAKGISERLETHQCYIKRLIEALYGRSLDVSDAPLIAAAAKSSLEGSSAKELFLKILSDSQITVRANK